MLTNNEIKKLRKLYFEYNFPVAKVARIMKTSRNTIYKYLNFVDFSFTIEIKTNKLEELEPYRDVILSWLENDRLHNIKQRHTAKRVYTRLKEEFPDFNCSMNKTQALFRELKNAKPSMYNGFLPLSHKPGEAQVDFGDCSFYENGIKINGKYLVMTFPYSNASYCQILHNKSCESIVEAMANIFEYLHGIPHTIWFDNDSSLVKLVHEPKLRRVYTDIFKRFILHYEFKEVFMNPGKGNEKGSVEAGIKFMRKNLLVPVPEFNDFIEYNKRLLKKSTQLHNREHYVVKDMIADLHFDDLHELNKLPPTRFEASSLSTFNLDNFGRLTISNNIFYYLSPEYAFKKVQVKTTPKSLEVYDCDGKFLIKTNRIYGKNGSRFINWSPYIRLLAIKPAAIMHFSFLELFTDDEIVNTVISFNRTKLYAFLLRFADEIDSVGLDNAVANVRNLF